MILETEVRTALEDILSSPGFGNVERQAIFLRHLVESALHGETNRLNEAVLGVEIFGRAATWDPELDAVVRYEAGRLRKRLARYYAAEGAKAEVRIRLPASTYVPIFVRPGSDEDIKPEPALEPNWNPWWYFAAGLLIAVGAVAYWLGLGKFQAPGLR